MTNLIYVLIGLGVGSISGIMGIGGGVLLVPALIWLCEFEPRKAAGTSLAVLIPPIGLPAAWRAYQENHVDLPAALFIAAAFTVGAYASRGLVAHIPDEWFRLAFGMLMMFIAMRLVIASDSEAASAAAGLTAVVLAWLGYLGLKLLGRRCLRPVSLGEQIQKKHEQGGDDSHYHI